jgi:hypothetical protein
VLGFYNGPLNEYKLAALAANIRKRNLQHPPEVVPPGSRAGPPAYTILGGHARKDAPELRIRRLTTRRRGSSISGFKMSSACA